MDHEVSGKRHVRAGAVTVAELIERQPSLIALPPEVLHAMEIGAGVVPQPRLAAVPERPRLEDSVRPPSLRARIVALTFGTIALLGAVSATAAISGAQPTGPVAHEPVGAPITGANALRPDMVAERLGYLPQREPQALTGTGQSATRPPNQGSGAAPAQASASPVAPTAGGGPQLGMSAPQIPLITPSGSASSTTDTATATGNPVDVVRLFYQRLETKSGDAQTLLDPGLLGADLPGFQLSWQSVRSVVPMGVAQQPDGSVLGTVSVQQSDGSWLRLQQHFSLNDARPPLIDRVELISAQQS